jgi:Xaa-Pro aminopeptidase
VLFEQGDLGFQIERHSPWIPKENVRYSYAWIKGAARAGLAEQVKKFTNAIHEEMKRHGVAGQKLGVDFIDINMIQIFKEKKINWVDGMTPMMEARAVKNQDEQECMRIVGAIGDAAHWEMHEVPAARHHREPGDRAHHGISLQRFPAWRTSRT